MREYAYKVMAELAGELGAGLLRLRKGYVDAAETLGRIIDPGREYPYDFVVYRLTGYRPPAAEGDSQPMIGGKLRLDLMQLMLDICDSFELPTADYDEKVYDTPGLARQYHVSTKTVQRWRRRGLAARRLVFPDGKRRVAFLDSSVQRFVGQQQSQVMRSMRFTQLTETERKDIIHRAKRMAAFTHCTLSDVAKRLATRTGRAVETIRYTIRNHDAENPDDAVFPYLSGPLSDQEKKAIYRCFLRGVPVSTLTERYRRTRGTIYRVINEMRANQLLSRPIQYVYNPQFDLPDADEIILAATAVKAKKDDKAEAKAASRPPADLPAYLRALYDVPLLEPQAERDLFRRYNYLKYKADRFR
ncbi:MAG: RNA polymerase subunit sigma-70, partial [Phycisphaerae bacterium]|nr:RNA polymerase subunit sigma-70 [Phycisphaerae bacterium]